MSTEAAIALIASSLALIGTLVTLARSARKDDLDVIRGIVGELKKEIGRLKLRERSLKQWASRLVLQVKELGGTPCDYEELDDPEKDDDK